MKPMLLMTTYIFICAIGTSSCALAPGGKIAFIDYSQHNINDFLKLFFIPVIYGNFFESIGACVENIPPINGSVVIFSDQDAVTNRLKPVGSVNMLLILGKLEIHGSHCPVFKCENFINDSFQAEFIRRQVN